MLSGRMLNSFLYISFCRGRDLSSDYKTVGVKRFSVLGLRVKISQTRLGQECLQLTKLITIQTDEFLFFFLVIWCFLSVVHQGTAGEHDSEGEAAGDGAAAEPEQSGAGETPTGLAGLLLPLTFYLGLCLCHEISGK